MLAEMLTGTQCALLHYCETKSRCFCFEKLLEQDLCRCGRMRERMGDFVKIGVLCHSFLCTADICCNEVVEALGI